MTNEDSEPLLGSRRSEGQSTIIWRRASAKIQKFQSSRFSVYFMLILVGVDVICIFTTIFIALHECDYGPSKGLRITAAILNEVGLAISCLFVVELLLSIWAFGKRYFSSWFRILDALVILASFIVDVALHGVAEEAASLVVVLRLWRIFKIVEEMSAGASLEMDGMYQQIADLEAQNSDLKREIAHLSGHP